MLTNSGRNARSNERPQFQKQTKNKNLKTKPVEKSEKMDHQNDIREKNTTGKNFFLNSNYELASISPPLAH